MAPEQRKRALIVTRLSRVTDATTSPERQRQACEKRCAERGYAIVGSAEDLDTSGSVSPFDRAELGAWLTKPHAFDVIVVWKLDRFTRSASDFWHFWRWTETLNKQGHKIELVTVEDSIDTTTAMGRTFAGVIAGLGEAELESISTRNRNAFRHNFTRGKWRGGVAPWGYVPEQIDGEWRLVQDPAQVAVIREVVGRVMAGEGLHSIAADLTRERVPTAKDAFALHQGKPVRGFAWHVSPLRRALRSETLRGWAVTKGEVVRDTAGKPLVRAEPILPSGDWRRLQARLDATARASTSRQPQSLLTGAIHCAVCGDPMWILRGGSSGRVDRYRCKRSNTVAPCGNRTIAATEADALYMTQIEPLMARRTVRREWRAGQDHRDIVADLDEQVRDLVGQLGRGVYRAGTPTRAALDKQIEGLAEERDALAAEPVVEPGYVEVEEGGTFGEQWEEWGPIDRNSWVRRDGPMMLVDARDGADGLRCIIITAWTPGVDGLFRRIDRERLLRIQGVVIASWDYNRGEVDLTELVEAVNTYCRLPAVGEPLHERSSAQVWGRLRWRGIAETYADHLNHQLRSRGREIQVASGHAMNLMVDSDDHWAEAVRVHTLSASDLQPADYGRRYRHTEADPEWWRRWFAAIVNGEPDDRLAGPLATIPPEDLALKTYVGTSFS